jgi:hypothetical protein
MITGKHDRPDALNRPRRAYTLTRGQPRSGRFQLAEGAGGLGELAQPSLRSLKCCAQWGIDHRSSRSLG